MLPSCCKRVRGGLGGSDFSGAAQHGGAAESKSCRVPVQPLAGRTSRLEKRSMLVPSSDRLHSGEIWGGSLKA